MVPSVLALKPSGHHQDRASTLDWKKRNVRKLLSMYFTNKKAAVNDPWAMRKVWRQSALAKEPLEDGS